MTPLPPAASPGRCNAYLRPLEIIFREPYGSKHRPAGCLLITIDDDA
jgi:hypothetical protein